MDDEYGWLEEDSERTNAWCAEQQARTQSYLQECPARPAIRARLKELLELPAISTPAPRKDRVFYFRREGRQNHAILYMRKGGGPETVVLDPNAWSEKGLDSLDWYYPNRDGTRIAYGRSHGGDELSTLRVLEVDSGEHLPDEIPYTRACSVSWLPDGSGFYYTRYPDPATQPKGQESYYRRVFFHTLGAAWAEDAPVYGEGRAPEDWPSVSLSPDGRYLLVFVSIGWSRTDVYLLDRDDGSWTTIFEGHDALFSGRVIAGTAYLTTNWKAPRYRLVAVDVTRPEEENWRELIAEREAVLEGAWVVGEWLMAVWLVDATSRLTQHDLTGRELKEIELPMLGSVSGLGSEWDGRELYYGFFTYTLPSTIFHLDLATGASTLWAKMDFPLNPDEFSVSQVFYPSQDGTRIPMFLVHRKDLALDGNNPTLLTGYGGFNVSQTPVFSRTAAFWIQSGGVYASANLRGGGEYGEAWHQAGMKDKKQNTFDDFIAAAEYLIREGYTRSERLAIQGGSNGGLLVGACLTQRPELYRAVVCAVPLLDMLRFHLFRVARLWIPEYGNPDDPVERAWLEAYSPVHNVREGVRYPALMLTAGASDSRVDPMHARKMAARLQAVGHDALLRIETEAGHGAGKPLEKVLDETSDIYAFLFRELGI